MAAREAEGDDEDETMVGAENISMQRAEGGGGTTGGIKKGKRTRSKRPNGGQRQRQAMETGRTDYWRRTRRAGVELTDEREGVPIAASLSWLRQGPSRSRWSSRRA